MPRKPHTKKAEPVKAWAITVLVVGILGSIFGAYKMGRRTAQVAPIFNHQELIDSLDNVVTEHETYIHELHIKEVKQQYRIDSLREIIRSKEFNYHELLKAHNETVAYIRNARANELARLFAERYSGR